MEWDVLCVSTYMQPTCCPLQSPPLKTNSLLPPGTAARSKKRPTTQKAPGPTADDDAASSSSFFPLLLLAYAERGHGAGMRVALRRWGLEAREVDGGGGDEGDEGEAGEGYRVHVLEVRLRGRKRG